MIGERAYGSRAERLRRRRSKKTESYYEPRRRTGGKTRGNPRNREYVRSGSRLSLRLGARWVTVPLLALALWGIFQALDGPTFQIGEVEVNGATIMSPSRVRSIGKFQGKTSFQIDPKEIVARLERLPEIEQAKVRIGWPNHVVVEIVERKPVLEWNDAGTKWWVSEDGLAVLQRSQIPELVRIHSQDSVLSVGSSLDPVLDEETIASALNFHSVLGEDQEILYDSQRGFGIHDHRGWMAYFGHDGDMALKYQVYLQIAEHLDQIGYPARLVSVEDLSAAFYR
jgi:hypothetical protein